LDCVSSPCSTTIEIFWFEENLVWSPIVINWCYDAVFDCVDWRLAIY
jgi:hypothetical protein